MWNGAHHRYSLDRLLLKKIRLKTDAETEAERIRTAIREGTFQPFARVGQPQSAEPAAAAPVLPTLTLAQPLENYRKDYIAVKRPGTLKGSVLSLVEK